MSLSRLSMRLFEVLLAGALAFQAAAAISYGAPQFANTGSQPSQVVVADFNNDCIPDFATVNVGDGTVTLRFGNGSGAFPTSSTISSGLSNATSIVTADFNGDGFPDLAVGNRISFDANPIGYTISILLNDGTGAFTKVATSPATSGWTAWLTTGDYNGDGHADLVAIDAMASTAGVSLYLGDGTGHFGAATVIPTNNHSPTAVITTDLNGDGHADLAVTTGDTLQLFAGNGDGTFGPATTLLFPDPVNGADGAMHVAAADLNHDGVIDLVTTSGNVMGGVTVFLNSGSGTTFTRSRFQMPTQPANPIFVALADLDGDGNIDIATANQYGCTPYGSNLAVRAGNGDGTFGPSAPVSVGYGPTCINSHWQPSWIAPIDLNCDGAADLIVSNFATSFASVLLTSGAADTTAPVVTAPPAVTVSAGSSCTAVVSDTTLGQATATDNCSFCVVITRSGVPAGNVFPAGSTVVTYTANDGHGNTASATQNVTVTDNTPPVLSATSPITAVADASCTGASVSVTPPTATDNCGTPTDSGVRSDAQSLSATYPLGITTITWTADDGHGNTSTATQTVTVTAPPVVISSATADVTTLWPPSHKMIPVTVSWSLTGGCGSVDCAVTSVTSNEPTNGLGDGDMPVDWQIVDAHHVLLRAERSALGTGRIYTITVTCTDAGGHTATKTMTVKVPLNQK